MHAQSGQTMKWKLVFRPKQTASAWKQAPYGNNLQPTLELFRLVTTTNTIAALEGSSRTEVMNDCFMWNQPTWRKVIALNSPCIKINTKEKYSLRTQTWLLSDLMFEIYVVHFCWNNFLGKNLDVRSLPCSHHGYFVGCPVTSHSSSERIV